MGIGGTDQAEAVGVGTDTLLEQGKPEEALRIIEKIEERSPRHRRVLMNKATALAYLDRRAAVDVPIIASGGASNCDHLRDAVTAGADAVLAASIFHYGDLTVMDVKEQLQTSGVEVRR